MIKMRLKNIPLAFFPEKTVDAASVIAELKKMACPENAAGMARFGIRVEHALGISVPALRALTKTVGMDHSLALALWSSGIHEARILASMIDDPLQATSSQLDRWVKDFDSWDVCDQVCDNLFGKTRYAARKAVIWAGRKPEFVRRAGFTLMAVLAWHDARAENELFIDFLRIIEQGSDDDRNFVKKAVNWALRNIGKRNRALYRAAIATARRIAQRNTRSARWISADALRELMDPRTLSRIKKHPSRP
jgi:3-methyladenine DNA glycosylase AlkD